MDLEDKKLYSEKWFSYLQAQIFKNFNTTPKVQKNLFQLTGPKKLMEGEELIKY